MLGVITDAVKLSKNCLIVLGNETWCRDWCVAAIISGVSTKTPVQTLTIGSSDVSSFDADYSISIVDTLAKQAPVERLRPLGLNDLQIPEAIRVVFMVKPVHFCVKDQSTMETVVTTLLNNMTGVRLQKGLQEFPEITSKFFSKASIKKWNWAEGQGNSKWYGKVQSYVLLSADQGDPEAVAVSSLCYALLEELIHAGILGPLEPVGNGGPSGPSGHRLPQLRRGLGACAWGRPCR